MPIKKVLLSKDGDIFYVPDDSKDYHMQYGTVKKEEFANTITHSNAKQKTLYIIDAGFIDNYRRLKRLAQIMHPKELGIIMGETGLGPDSTIIEAGSGSGAASCFFARYVKQVISYDINREHQAVAKENAVNIGLNNITFKEGDIAKEIEEKDADLLLLDIPEPWTAIGTAASCLKNGGFFVTYSPTILQVHQAVTETDARQDFIYLKTVEIIEREWHIQGKSVRPKMQNITHTGFLSFFRKVTPE